MKQHPRKAVLLLYTGSPDAPTPQAVRRYLKRFLMDPRVLTMPGWARLLLVHGIIAPMRARSSAAKYADIWMAEGSPLVVLTNRFRAALQAALPEYRVSAASAYGAPTVADALDELTNASCQKIIVLPMFPHYAEATRGSLLATLNAALARLHTNVETAIIPSFYDDAGYIEAICAAAAPALDAFKPDHLVCSYHGLPVRQGRAIPRDGIGVPYEDQCRRNTEMLRAALGLDAEECTHAYQSRFGWGWLEPALEPALERLAETGRRRVALLAPSFVTDCLETLEELDLRARACFMTAGGEAFLRVPSLNDHALWVTAAADMVRRAD